MAVLASSATSAQVFRSDIDTVVLSVTVTEAVFAGERCRYMLQAGDGTSIVLKEPSSAAIRRRTVGERAEIAWSVADTILV